MLLLVTSLPDEHVSLLTTEFQVEEIYIQVQSLIQVWMGVLLIG